MLTNSRTAATELDDTYFEPSLSDVQSYHATVISRSKRLNEAPLLTSKHRDEDRLAREKKKAEKWPTVSALGE
jgi:tether containing UBX domain for GLUT4